MRNVFPTRSPPVQRMVMLDFEITALISTDQPARLLTIGNFRLHKKAANDSKDKKRNWQKRTMEP